MAINLLDLFKDQVGDQLVKNAGSLLNEQPSNVQKALDGILPTVLGSVAQKGSSQSGAEAIIRTISEGGFDGGLLDKAGDLLSGGGSGLDDVLNQGGNLLDMLIGGSQKQSGVVDMIANFAGLNKGSTGSLFKLAAPMMMSLIGKQVKSKGLNVGSLMNLLGDQSDFIKSAMPAGLAGIGKLLDFSGPLGNLGAVAEEVVEETRETVEAAATTGRNWLPWVAGIVVLGGLLYFLMNRGGEVEQAMEDASATVVEETQRAAESVQEAAKNMGDDVGLVRPVDEQITKVLEAGEEWRDVDFLFSDRGFSSGSTQFSTDLMKEIEGLAQIMQANPGMKIMLTSFAADGQAQAEQRSLAIKSKLQELGIASNRIATGGEATNVGNRVELTITDL